MDADYWNAYYIGNNCSPGRPIPAPIEQAFRKRRDGDNAMTRTEARSELAKFREANGMKPQLLSDLDFFTPQERIILIEHAKKLLVVSAHWRALDCVHCSGFASKDVSE